MNCKNNFGHLDNNGHVKTCPKCKTQFTIEQLFNDPDIIPIGLCLEDGLTDFNCYYFNHEIESCKTTFTVQVEQFSELIKEEITDNKLTETVNCEGRCLRIDEQDSCSQACHYAPFRDLLSRMREAKESRYQALNH